MLKSDPEQFADLVFAQLPDNVTKHFRRRALSEHGSSPTVVAIPTRGPIDMAEHPGGFQYEGKAGRPILMRRLGIEWWCHAAPTDNECSDFLVAESLFKLVLTLVRNTAHNEVRFSDERWYDQEDGNDAFTNWGAVVVFTSTVFFPVYDIPSSSLAEVLQLALTNQGILPP